MQEVQFISDLVINFIEGLIDYNPAKIKTYYKNFDEAFPEEENIAARMEAIFGKLVALPSTDFSDTIFRSAQIAFSLMQIIDEQRETPPSVEFIHEVIRAIDATVTAATDDPASITEIRYLTGFTGGNLHRIRSRRARHDILDEAFL
jgi:hypothetical protein